MDEKILQFRIGVVVLAAFLIGGLMVMMLGKFPSPFLPKYTILAKFPSAPGVTAETPVRKSGIRIGRVARVDLQPQGGVLLTLQIDQKYKLHRNELCRISTGSLVTGDAVVEFIPQGEPREEDWIQDGEFINTGAVAGDPFEAFVGLAHDVRPAIRAIETAGNEVTRLSQGLNQTIGSNDENVKRILQKSEVALEQFQRTMKLVDDLIGDPELKGRLKQVLEDLPKLFDDAHQMIADARGAVASLREAGDSLNENMENLKGFTEPLGENGEHLVKDFGRSMDSLSDLMQEFQVFAEALNRGEGTLGRVIHDDELYVRLNRAATNIEDATRRLRPIMDDVRIITDKVARDPGGSVGLRSLLDRRPTGLKTGFLQPTPP